MGNQEQTYLTYSHYGLLGQKPKVRHGPRRLLDCNILALGVEKYGQLHPHNPGVPSSPRIVAKEGLVLMLSDIQLFSPQFNQVICVPLHLDYNENL